jgi:biopolymer transport protein TolR
MHLTTKKKSADLNLVPYIDLLTALIAFLLITAVWTQLAQLRVPRHGEGGDVEGLWDKTRVTVVVGEQGFNLVVDETSQSVPRRSTGFDFAALQTALHEVKARLPDQKDVVVASEDGITYDTIVGTMDTVLAAGFPTPSLEAAAPRP